MSLKNRLKQLEHSDYLIGRTLYKSMRQLLFTTHWLTNAKLRSESISWLKYRKYIHQRHTTTVNNRYPELFSACAEYLKNESQPKVLSFGCSTGEEVLTLGEYIPAARIVGVDINNWCIRQSKKRDTGNNFLFYHSLSTEFKIEKDFDAIFCLAVFQRSENRINNGDRTTNDYTFRHFEREVAMLDEKLKRGGLFIIDHADFSFTDTICAAWYEPLECEGNRAQRNRPVYGRDSYKKSESHNSYRVFKKMLA